MGSITPYTTAAGRRYRVRYRDPDHHSREKNGFVRRRDAEDYLANITVTANRGDYVDPRAARITVGELGAIWIQNQTHLKASTFATVETSWRVHVAPAWSHKRIGSIRHSEVQAWLTSFAAGDGKPRSATVVLRAYGVLAGILDVAVRDRQISSNPARGVKLPRKAKKRRIYLTAAQVEHLARQSGHHATLIYTLAYTGVRWGEAVGLRVQAVDLARRRMVIEENAVNVGGTIVVGSPKTHERRSVSYPQFLAGSLAAACTGKSGDQLVFGDGMLHLKTPKSTTGWFWSAVKKCQKIDPTFPTVTPHDLRHTAASLAISAGANPKAVQRMLGHASAAMTLDTYADLFEDDLDAVSDRLNRVREQAVVGFLWGFDPKPPQTSPENA